MTQMYNGWSYSLFNYGPNCGKCICAMCLPCYVAAYARTQFDNSSCLFNCLCLGPAAVRNIIREGYGITGDCLEDICFSMYFPACAITQAWAEVSKRGSITKQSTSSRWAGGLCSCCDYPGVCLYGMLCPVCASASQRTAYDESNCIFNCVAVGQIAAYNIVREGYGIEGTCCWDIIVMWCLPPCGIVQMHREIQTRGKISRTVPTANANAPVAKQMF